MKVLETTVELKRPFLSWLQSGSKYVTCSHEYCRTSIIHCMKLSLIWALSLYITIVKFIITAWHIYWLANNFMKYSICFLPKCMSACVLSQEGCAGLTLSAWSMTAITASHTPDTFMELTLKYTEIQHLKSMTRSFSNHNCILWSQMVLGIGHHSMP